MILRLRRGIGSYSCFSQHGVSAILCFVFIVHCDMIPWRANIFALIVSTLTTPLPYHMSLAKQISRDESL